MKRAVLRMAGFAMLAAGVSSVTATAQEARGPSHFFVSGGVGKGNLAMKCSFEACPVAHVSSVLTARASYVTSTRTAIGFEWNRWQRTLQLDTASYTTSYTWIGPAIEFFPFDARYVRGLHLSGMVGVATMGFQTAQRVRGLGGGAGIGVDVPVFNFAVIAPYAAAYTAEHASQTVPVRGSDGRLSTTSIWYSARMTSFGVSVKLLRLP